MSGDEYETEAERPGDFPGPGDLLLALSDLTSLFPFGFGMRVGVGEVGGDVCGEVKFEFDIENEFGFE